MSWRWIVALAAVVLAGCGSEPRLSASAAGELHGGVEAVRAAAGAGDREGTLRALDRLSERIAREAADGRLAEADAADLRRAIARARRRAEREIAAPQPTAEPAPEATAEPTVEPTAEPPARSHGKKEGKKEGKKGGKHHEPGDDGEGDD